MRGQSTAEYLGALLVVSVVVAALATTDAGARIGAESKRIVCLIGGGDCRPEPEAPRTIQGDDPQGPPLGDRPIEVLPFPGSVTVRCTYPRRQPPTCTPDGEPGVSVQATGEVNVERTPTSLDENGCAHQSASVGTTLQLSANAAGERGRVSGSLSAYLGESTTYQITTSPGQMDDIADGDRQPPNPVDPTTIRRGESVELTEEFYAGVSAEATYRALQIEMGFDRGRRVSSGVQRVDASTMRVLVGDADFVRQALSVGVGVDDFGVSIGNTDDLSDGELHAIDIDISTPEGWAAYQQFLGSGRLPAEGAPGTSNRTEAETLVYTSVTEAGVDLGPLEVGGQLGDSEGRVIETTNADGTVDTVRMARYGNIGLALTTREDADGDRIGRPTRSLLLEGVDSSLVEMLYDATGQDAPDDLPENLRLDFTRSQLNQLREIALDRLADRIEESEGERPSTAEIAESLRENDGVAVIDGVHYDFSGLEALLGEARTPEETLLALYRGASDPNALLQQLVTMVRDDPDGMDVIRVPDC